MNDIVNLITGGLNPTDKKNVLESIKSDDEKRDLYKKAKLSWALIASGKKMPKSQFEDSYRTMQKRIRLRRNTFRIRHLTRYAAILVSIVALSAVMHYWGKHSVSGEALQYTSVVAEYGQISKVILPDSSVVWLNSGTTLSYNNKFAVDNRDLKLEGQAYLSVRKNKNLPLVVSVNDLNVKVLGTRFDVNAYRDDDNVTVVLEEGSVELLQPTKSSFSYKLRPGEMAVYGKNPQKLDVTQIETTEFTNWKSGELNFQDAKMEDVIKKLERKYGITVEVANPEVYNSVFNAKFKNESLETVIDFIEFTCQLKAELIADNGINKKVIFKK